MEDGHELGDSIKIMLINLAETCAETNCLLLDVKSQGCNINWKTLDLCTAVSASAVDVT